MEAVQSLLLQRLLFCFQVLRRPASMDHTVEIQIARLQPSYSKSFGQIAQPVIAGADSRVSCDVSFYQSLLLQGALRMPVLQDFKFRHPVHISPIVDTLGSLCIKILTKILHLKSLRYSFLFFRDRMVSVKSII